MMRYDLVRSSQLYLACSSAELQVCTGRRGVEGCVGANHGSSWKGLAKRELSQLGGLISYRSVKVSCLSSAISVVTSSCRRQRCRNTELMRARSANRLCPWNRSTTLHVRTGGPSLNAQF